MNLYLRLLSFTRKYVPQILTALICITFVAGTTLLIAPLAGHIFKVIEEKDFALLNWAALAMIGLFFAKGVFAYGQDYWAYYIVHRVIVDLRNRVYEHLQDLSLDFYAKWNTGELVSRVMADILTLQTTLMTFFTMLIPHSILLIGLLGYIFWLNWKLSILTFVALPLIIQVIRIFAQQIRRISEGVQQKAADITSHLQETISQIRVVKSFSMEKHEINKFRNHGEKSFHINMEAVKVLATQNPVVALLQTSAVVAIIWFGGSEIIRGNLTVPQLISFATALGIMTDPGNTLSRGYTLLQQGMASAQRIFEVLDIAPTIKDAANAISLPRIKGQIEYKDLSFAYDNNDVLKNINLSVKSGESIALIGRTGAGKSTIINLLLRFYDPTKGQVLVDGQDIKEVKMASLRQQIAVVPQEIALFSGSIRDNIAYSKPDASLDEIISAAKQANIDKFINGLPEKYDTQVGERGATLSGGERQRVAIARAILRDPRILILDEATSSLDAETETLIREALDRLMKGRTTFIIAHRLYTVEHVNRIVVIDAGQIAESGSHQELIDQNGLYKHLYEIQLKNKK